MSDGTEDLAFGDGGFAKIYGDRLADSSLLDCAVASRWVFMFMLARADSQGRFRCATVAGLARAAAVSIPEAEAAVAELEAADPDSTSADADGRRILRIPGGWQVVTYAKYRDYRTKRQLAEAEKKRRQRAGDREDDGGVGGHVPGHPGDVPGISAQTPDVRRQTPENEQRKGGGGSSRGIATARERERLEADPVIADLGDHWAQHFKRPGRELGVLRAASTAVAGGYAPEAMKLVVRVVAIARKAPERFPDRGSIRWAVEHGKAGDPGYLLRTSTLDRLIPEAEAWDQA